MNDTVSLALVLGSAIIIIGFLSNYLFDRTGFPDMLFLILLGVILGPILNVFDPSTLVGLAPYVAALALVFILFDGGIRLNIYQVFAESSRAVLLAVLSFAFSVATTTLFAHFLLGVEWLYSILLGSIYGGSSAIAVISLATKVNVSERCVTILSLESAVSNVLQIVVSLAVIGIILTGQADYAIVSQEISAQFSTGAVIGVLFGVAWLSVLKRVARVPYAYMLTLAIVLLAYTTSEYLGGSGALSSLLFGVILGNEKEIFKMLRLERARATLIDEGMKRFESEIAFLIRAFFFVYLGLIATITSIEFVYVGVVLSLLLLLARFGAVWLTSSSELWSERPIMGVMMTRGLAVAVLATLPMQQGLPYSEAIINLAVVVIVSTAIICTVGVMLQKRVYT